MENNITQQPSANHAESRGWQIVKEINELLTALHDTPSSKRTHAHSSRGPQELMRLSGDEVGLKCRKLLAEYCKLDTRKPSKLHSAILLCAVKMAVEFPDFHFVPFLGVWGLENLRPEDNQLQSREDGKFYPSLSERMVKAYVYSLLFHPEERLQAEVEETMKPVMVEKGYLMGTSREGLQLHIPVIAIGVFQSSVRNRTVTFVRLLTPSGSEMVTEWHTLTRYHQMRYDDVTNRCFNVILRNSESGKQRVEAAFLYEGSTEDIFPTEVGFVDFVDEQHHHIHVFDNKSRHLVEKYATITSVKAGDYVRFIPIIPKESNFKSALILKTLSDGPEAFGYRKAIVTHVNAMQHYCAWELLPDANGQVHPIEETGASEQHEPGTKGYINKPLCDRLQCALPQKGTTIEIIAFLKRGKDRVKRPVVVDFR